MKILLPAMFAITSVVGATAVDAADGSSRFLFDPAIHGDTITFVADDQLWAVDRRGGLARPLTAMAGAKARPEVSPDGRKVAFTADAADNQDVYVLDLATAKVDRITYHPGIDRLQGWSGDGHSLLFSSSREHPFGGQNLFVVPTQGGLPRRLPMSKAYGGALSPDGTKLAYEPTEESFHTWKRYRGGRAVPLRIVELASMTAADVPGEPSNNFNPVWVGRTLYFLSDRGGSFGIYRYVGGATAESVFARPDVDIDSFSADGTNIVFSADGHLWTLEDGVPRRLAVDLPPAPPQPARIDAAANLAGMALSPDGSTIAIEARGDLFLEAAPGQVVALTASPGIAERTPIWSPKGDRIAYAADPDGKPTIAVIAPQAGAKPRYLGYPDAGFPTGLVWSADGTRIAYLTHSLSPAWVDVRTGRHGRASGQLIQGTRLVWSGDFLFFIDRTDTAYGTLMQVDTRDGTVRAVTDGMAHVADILLAEDAKALYIRASLDAGPTVTEYDASDILFAAGARAMIYRIALDHGAVPEGAPLVALPETAGNFATVGRQARGLDRSILFAAGGRLGLAQRTGPAPPFWDYYAPEDGRPSSAPKTAWTYLLYGSGAVRSDDASTIRFNQLLSTAKLDPSASPRHLLFREDGKATIVDLADDGTPQAITERAIGALSVRSDPHAEWAQIYYEAARRFRDYFYTPTMNGVDWPAMTAKYGAWLPDLRSRSDLDFVLTKLAAEVRNSHTYVSPAKPAAAAKPEGRYGFLGADFSADDKRIIVRRLLEPSPWDVSQSPLKGVALSGDAIVAVDGKPVDAATGLDAALVGTGGRPVEILLQRAGRQFSRTVVPAVTERGLRQRDWVESRRRLVAERSGGRIAYLHAPDTSGGGISEFVRYFFPQTDRQAIIIDERFNEGGADLDYVLDTLGRTRFSWYTARGVRTFEAPASVISGPKVMLVNEEAGSGGDVFPYQFKVRKLGSVIGTRTWGGVNGGYRPIDPDGTIDGGRIFVPNEATYAPTGEPILENKGIDPDVTVRESPADDARGFDTQLEAGVAFLLKRMATDMSEKTKPSSFAPHQK